MIHLDRYNVIKKETSQYLLADIRPFIEIFMSSFHKRKRECKTVWYRKLRFFVEKEGGFLFIMLILG